MTGDFSEYLRENCGAVWYDQLCEPEDKTQTRQQQSDAV
jgi:hypothetical protein